MDDCDCHYCQYRRNPNRSGDLESIHDTQKAMGGVSHMFVRRRAADPRFRFPEVVRIGRRIFIRRRDREEWMLSPHAQLTTTFNAPGRAA